MVEKSEHQPPQKLRDADARNVTGAEFTKPHDLDGYLDEPTSKFGLWVGESEDEAELLVFEVDGEQIEHFAELFEMAAVDVRDLRDSEGSNR